MTPLDTRQLFQYLCKPELARTLSPTGWQQVILVLREAKLLASFCVVAEQCDVLQYFPPYARRHLISARVYADRQAQQIHFECSQLQQLFAAADIEVVFLKGAAYTLAQTANSAGRICSDLDVLVRREQLTQAETLLKQQSWRADPLTDYDQRYYRQWAHEIPPMVHLHRGTVLDLHHNVYLPVSGRAADMTLFFHQLQQTPAGVSVLAPPAMVLHSIIHLFTNEDTSSGMRDIWDLYLLLQQAECPAFWQQLVDLARQTGFYAELLHCLATLQHYFALDYYAKAAAALSPLAAMQRSVWRCHILPAAMVPEHPLVLCWRHKVAKQLVYLHGHWMKMPALILLKHLSVKSGLALRDKLFGKHHFAPKLPPNQHW
jgi:hypothetical protein